MDTPRIWSLAMEKPVLVFEDTIYELSDTFLHQDLFLSVNGIRKGFVQSQNVRFEEERQFTEELKSRLASKRDKIYKQAEKLESEFGKLKDLKNSNDATEFIKKFLETWHLFDARKTEIDPAQYAYRKASESMYNPVEELFRPLEKQATASIFSSKMGGYPVFFMRGLCYRLFPEPSANGIRDFVQIRDKAYRMQFEQTLEAFITEYETQIGSHLDKRVAKETEGLDKHIEAEKKRRGELQAEMLKIPRYNDVGHICDSTNTYIWTLVEPALELASQLDGGSKFLFPSCKIGIRLIKTPQGIDFDRNPAEGGGGIRVLEAKQVVNGVETGNMSSMRNKHYTFPSASEAFKDYTYICISPKGMEIYKQYDPAVLKKPVIHCLQKLLRDAVGAMKYGYGESGIYFPISIEGNRARFANFRIGAPAQEAKT
jgi:hypothetical protein